jgi:hypothetical protein
MIAQDNAQSSAAVNRSKQRSLVIRPKKLVFYTIFILAFLLSGILVMLDIFPYRMNPVSLLVLPLIFLYGIRFDKVVLVFGLLVLVILLSAIINQVSVTQLVLFLRSVAFAFLIYSLVRMFVKRDNIVTIIKLCVLVGMVQLPIMLMQFMTYDALPSRIRDGMRLYRIDYSFGTFHYKGDAAMTFFLTLLVIFLLFDYKRNYFIRYKWFVAIWLTLTVLVSNAEIMKLAIIFVWVVFAIRFLSIKTLFYLGIGLVLLAGILFSFGVFNDIIDEFSYSLTTNLSASESKTEAFMTGGYGRGAAIAYYLNNELEVIGDGPSRYYDAVSQEYLRGNYGHIFTYYSEVGLVGLLLSYLIFFLIAFPLRGGRIQVRWVGVLIFSVLLLLSFTTEVLPNISIVLIYCIVAMTYLIPQKEALTSEVVNR